MNTATKIINQLLDEVAELEATINGLRKENEQFMRWWLEEKGKREGLEAVKLAPGTPDPRD
jgi:hypothetical protein